MNPQRRYDLDWIRVLVFGLLILFHIGMFFVPWQWHIQNNELSDTLVYPMWFLSEWRLPVLFIISGMGTRFALSSRNWKQYLAERHNRLIIPLLFGMLVVVAPQVYAERMVQGAGYSSFWDFYPHYFDGVYPEGNFSWHHLWFLPYLLVYSVILSPLFIRIRNKPENLFMQIFRRVIQHRTGVLLLAIPLVLAEIALKPHFPVFQNLINDWYAFTRYLILFLYGYLFIAAGETFWEFLNRKKFPAFIIGLIAFPLLVWTGTLLEGSPLVEVLYAFIRITNLGAWCLVIFGYGAILLNRPSTALSYCNQAVYPFYIVHQTFTVIAAWYIYELHWPVGSKFLFLTAITFGGSWAVFEIARRVPILRPLFGIKPIKKSRTESG